MRVRGRVQAARCKCLLKVTTGSVLGTVAMTPCLLHGVPPKEGALLLRIVSVRARIRRCQARCVLGCVLDGGPREWLTCVRQVLFVRRLPPDASEADLAALVSVAEPPTQVLLLHGKALVRRRVVHLLPFMALLDVVLLFARRLWSFLRWRLPLPS